MWCGVAALPYSLGQHHGIWLQRPTEDWRHHLALLVFISWSAKIQSWLNYLPLNQCSSFCSRSHLFVSHSRWTWGDAEPNRNCSDQPLHRERYSAAHQFPWVLITPRRLPPFWQGHYCQTLVHVNQCFMYHLNITDKAVHILHNIF